MPQPFHTHVLSRNLMPQSDLHMWPKHVAQQTQKLSDLFLYLDL
jgi:hypothetical protein